MGFLCPVFILIFNLNPTSDALKIKLVLPTAAIAANSTCLKMWKLTAPLAKDAHGTYKTTVAPLAAETCKKTKGQKKVITFEF